jgi:enoyl-CoA hydratase/carnithine racemase
MYDLSGVLTIEADGPVRTVVINRPVELNAVDRELHWALANIWRSLAADLEAKVVILAGFAAEAATMRSSEHRARLIELRRTARQR